MKRSFALFFGFALACLTFAAFYPGSQMDPLTEYRYCGAPVRNADGTIHRSARVLAAFQKQHPCPSTGKTTGACPGWALNHSVPLACGGCDHVANLDWMPDDEKSAAGPHARDRYERKVYQHYPDPIPDTAACRLAIVP